MKDATAPLRALVHLTDPALAPFFEDAERLGSHSAWWGHVPFARWLIGACEPQVLVELGTHHGVSYAAFCSAVLRGGFGTACHAVDTWLGDRHAGAYPEEVFEDFRAFHDARYAGFSTLHRCTFDDARRGFADGSVDLLHVDGLHTFDAVRHDFEMWLSAMSERGVMLFHDTMVRRDDFGVWRFWEDVRSRYPSFHFRHGHGLGVLAVGPEPPPAIAALCAWDATAEGDVLRERFAAWGARWIVEAERRAALERLQRRDARSRADLAELQRLRAIEQGAIWRATGPMRRLLDRHPTLRRWLLRLAVASRARTSDTRPPP